MVHPYDPFDSFLRFLSEDSFRDYSPFQATSFGRSCLSSLDRERLPSDRSKPELSRVCSQDFETVLEFKDNVISGYLNLGAAEGWKEGSDHRIGISFVRYILLSYWFKNKERLGSNAIVFEKVTNAFRGCETLLSSFFFEKGEVRPYPKESKICYDSSVVGWQKHSVGRLVGNVGSTYDPKKPFFEILINSARSSEEDSVCNPFFISVYANEEEIEKRRTRLLSLRSAPAEIAHFSFYATYLAKPDAFLKEHQKKLGPNSTRLLQALVYLQNTSLNAQKVGNCWIKQPMRCLLAILYVELISNRPELTPEAAWNEAKRLYKNVQKTVAIPLVEDLIRRSDVPPGMRKTAYEGLARQRQL